MKTLRATAGRRRALAFLVGTAALLAAVSLGCSSAAPGGTCSSNDQCPAGEVCNNGACLRLCVADLQCADGQICSESTCKVGRRDAPTLTDVDGDGSTVCPDAEGTHCLLAGVLVVGTNLAGASFTLTPEGESVGTPLTVRSGGADVQVVVDLPDVAAGDYLLAARNAAGEDQLALRLLQGPPGEAFSPSANQLVQLINSATLFIDDVRLPHDHDTSEITSGVFPVARLPIGDSAANVAAGNHSHDAAALATGTVAAARLPVGTAAAQVAAGDHSHLPTVLNVVATNAVALSDVNTFGDMPSLTQGFTLTREAFVMVRYSISMPGGGGHLVTRLNIDGAGQADTRGITGNTAYWHNEGEWMGRLPSGAHTIKVEYRANIAQTSTPTSDWESRSLQVVYFP